MLTICNYIEKMIFVRVLYSCLIVISFNLISCSHFSRSAKPDDAKILKLSEPVVITMDGVAGHIDKSKHYSFSLIKTFKNNQIQSEKQEIVEFVLETKTTKVDKEKGLVFSNVTTISKDGQTNLNDMSYPELNQTISYILDHEGTVLKAGDYNPKSLFYVPSLPLSKLPLVPGDTWDYKGSWVSEIYGVEFLVNLVMVYKDAYSCYNSETCYEISFSGGVEIPVVLGKDFLFQSTINGNMFYRPNTGTIISSDIRNDESMSSNGTTVNVTSCLVSVLDTLKEAQNLKCEPAGLVKQKDK